MVRVKVTPVFQKPLSRKERHAKHRYYVLKSVAALLPKAPPRAIA
jgi:hypothetical protein